MARLDIDFAKHVRPTADSSWSRIKKEPHSRHRPAHYGGWLTSERKSVPAKAVRNCTTTKLSPPSSPALPRVVSAMECNLIWKPCVTGVAVASSGRGR